MNILVCGGAGYIGSHCVKALLGKGHRVSVLDNLERGHLEAVADDAVFYPADLRNADEIVKIFKDSSFDAVIHFAACSRVEESVCDPLKYYENNFTGTLNLLKAMKNTGPDKIVFSSTASVYGIPKFIPVTEDTAEAPINPYGDSKLAAERLLKWCGAAYGIKSVSLRYFNVAGACDSGETGEDHEPETHIIPNVLKSIISQSPFRLFGNDYNTPDGTCVRDYIHIDDLIGAHILALGHLFDGGETKVYNLGSQNGYSNLEIIHAAERVTGKKLNYSIEGRRPGDPDTLVASHEKIKRELGWKPVKTLDDMIKSAYKWHLSHPNGYGTLK